jgi:hypothetical protein
MSEGSRSWRRDVANVSNPERINRLARDFLALAG